MSHWLFGAVTLDILDAKIKHTAELGKTSFGHDGEIYTNLRSVTRSDGTTGYRFDHEDNESYVKSYFIKNDGTWLFVTERGHPTVSLRFDAPFDENDTLGGRFNELNDALDESVFNARLGAAIQNYELTGEPQDFKWRGNSYTNLQDTGKSTVDYRFDHGSGDDRKAFFFAEDGSHVFGWSKTGGGQSYHHPDKTETDSLYDRLVEVDEKLPSSYAVPLTLDGHLDILDDDPGGRYDFQLAGRDMAAVLTPNLVTDYLIYTHIDFVNDISYSYGVALSSDGTFFALYHPDFGLLDIGHDWGWSPTDNSELGGILYGSGQKDTLYNRVLLFEYQLNGIDELYNAEVLTDNIFLSGFNLDIDQVPTSDEIRFNLHVVVDEYYGYGSGATDIYAVFTRDLAGPEIRSISLEGESYNLLDYGEDLSVEGSIQQDRIQLDYEAYDALGFGETLIIDVVIDEGANGYVIDFDLSSEDLFIPIDCSATIRLDQEFTIISTNVNCSDNDLEAELESALEDVAEEAASLVAVSNGLQDVFIMNEYDFVDETAPEYIGAFAPVDDDLWVG